MNEDKQQNQNSDSTEEADNAEELKTKCDEYLAGWKRAQADYANLKRETERDRIEFQKYAAEEILHKLLPTIDGIDAALSLLPESTDKDWAQGLRAVYSQLYSFLQDVGLEKIDCSNGLDPMVHEAVAQEKSDLPENQIVRVVQSGWMLRGKALRPSKVVIAKTEKINP